MGDPHLTVSGASIRTPLLLLCLFGTLLRAVVTQTTSNISRVYVYPAAEMAGLQALREAWNNTPNASGILQNWGANTDPCGYGVGMRGWAGVSGCIALEGPVFINPAGKATVQVNVSVTALRFDRYNEVSLTGSIPPQISLLSKLETLLLASNPNLSSPIPKELGLLTSLSVINLNGNNLSGELPNTNISMLQGLKFMSIAWNRFQGSIKQDYFQDLFFLQRLDLSVNNFTGHLPKLTNFYFLTYLDVSSNKFTGTLPTFETSYVLKTLNVSSNCFTGLSHNLTSFFLTLPKQLSIFDLSSLEIQGPLPLWSAMTNSTLSELYLDNNYLMGTLNISALVNSSIGKNLNVLSLKDNNIAEVASTNELLQGLPMKIFLQGNPYCNNTWPSKDEAARCFILCEHVCIYKPKSHNWKVILTSSIVSSTVMLVLTIMALAFILCWNQRYTQDLLREIKQADVCAKRFEYNQLRVATRNFAPDMKLGAGAFGAVYKGILENNVVVAVKQLFLETSEGKDDFLNEVFLISNLQHRNLVTLKGYCLHGKQTLLIYEFVDNCDLDKVLLSRHQLANDTSSDSQMTMTWPARMKVCQGVAQGLFYLHASSQSRIIHRDIKASNILLDKNFHPKIADFGLARPMKDAKSVIHTQQCAGTMGYLAPEYACNGELSEKADVFSFGVLLLEIVSGKRNTDLTMPDDEVYLPNQAKKLHKESRLMDLQDKSLIVSANEALEVQQVLEVAMMCVQNAPERRPTMFQVAVMLEGNAKVQARIACDDSNDSCSQDMTCISVDSESECPLFSLSASAPQSDENQLTDDNGMLELSIMHNGM